MRKRQKVDKTVVSLYLKSEVVGALDALASERETTRSHEANRVLRQGMDGLRVGEGDDSEVVVIRMERVVADAMRQKAQAERREFGWCVNEAVAEACGMRGEVDD
jgi:predicted transcriptional regulator